MTKLITFISVVTFSLCSFAALEVSPASCKDDGAIYKTCGDQKAAFDKAVAKAKKEKKVLFITFGADWCPWCRSLHLVSTSEDFKKLMAAEKIKGKSLADVVTFHNIGVSHKVGDNREPVESGRELFQKIAADTKSGEQKIEGIPTLVFLNPAKNKAVFRSTENLEVTGTKTAAHDPAKVVAAIKEAVSKL